MKNKKVLVDYTSREFNSIKSDLENHARLYFPDSYKDFSENSFGSFILDTVSYVGDMMSFYLDYQVNESFLDTAVEYSNIRRLAKNGGYVHSGRPAAFAMATFYVVVPAAESGLGPNTNLIPILKQGAEITSDSGVSFVLLEDVDFSNPNNEVVASEFSSISGKPTKYALRAYGQIKSVSLFRVQLTVGTFEKFARIRVGPETIQEIHSVFDSEGNQYYEVDHLSQDVIYVNTTNPNALSDGVPEIIKPKIVKRRFIIERDNTGTYMRFGYSDELEDTSSNILDPSTVALKMSGKNYITDTSFDPSSLLGTSELGISPQNTTLTVRYYRNSGDSINLASNQLTSFLTRPLEFPGEPSAQQSINIRQSLEVSNDEPIIGNTRRPSSDELKYRTYAEMFSQKRAVTRNDYEAVVYNMPPSLGSVKRASMHNDPSSTNRRLSLYVISADQNDNLITTNSTIKQNIKTWLNKSKMLNDNIDVYDAIIINLGFDYEVIVDPTRDKNLVLNNVQRSLEEYVSDKMYIGEPFYITNIFNVINKVSGVIDTTKVTPILKLGANYSGAPISIDEMKSKDGTYLRAPKNVIYEVKFPRTDIRGTAI